MNKRNQPDSPKVSWFPLSIGVASMAGMLLFVAHYKNSGLVGQAHNNPNDYNPSQTQNQTAPREQQAAGRVGTKTGSLQKGVSASDVTVHLNVGTSPSIPAFDPEDL